MRCLSCDIVHDGTFGSGKFCSRSCANRRMLSSETKQNISKSVINFNNKKSPFEPYTKVCEQCKIEFLISSRTQRKRKLCSKKCAMIKNHRLMSSSGGKKSAMSQSRRSKNEIYFAELCAGYFNHVETNVTKFNGWDADVIIDDIKVAILWNGKWHYEKITESHSLSQVQNRDRLKIKEIKQCGYEPYIIKDMGGYDKKFVEEQFSKFIAGRSSDPNGLISHFESGALPLPATKILPL